MPEEQEVEISLTRFGRGFVKVNGQEVDCQQAIVFAKAGQVPRVRLTLVPKRIRIKSDGAEVTTEEIKLGARCG
jgi:hypothetical protein